MDDRQRLEAIVSVINKYLPPDGIPINDAMSEIISLVDPLPAPQPAQELHEYDWSMLEAAKESLREHMARIKELEAALAQPAQEQWNAALDEAAARIGEIKGFGKATQDSFAIYIHGLKK